MPRQLRIMRTLIALEARKEAYDRRFHLEEIATIMMLMLLAVLILVSPRRDEAGALFFLNIALAAVVAAARFAAARIKSKWFILYRDFSLLLMLIIIYLEHGILIPLINPHDVDFLLLAIDRALFGGHLPTILLERVTFPLLTEILQLVYASFYFLPLSLCMLLYMKGLRISFHIAASTIMIGFYISYIGYYLAPALGPRYTIPQLQSFPLEGVFAYQFLRDLLDAAAGVTRDCYPSGHTLVSVLTVLLARKYYRSFLPAALVWMLGLLVSTVYLRYHYVIDVIAGLLLAAALYGLVPAVARYITGSRPGKLV